MKDLTIIKFGGTSLSTDKHKRKIVEIIKEKLNNDEKVVVVVSAIGRNPEKYATDTLLENIDSNFKENYKYASDLLMSCGETISSVIITNYLVNNGIPAVPLTGGSAGIITNNKFGDASPIKYKPKFIKELITKKKVPIVTGFQGITKEGFVTTMGRGGSDTTATILGDMLNANKIEIYTDVDGIYDKDPTKYSDAKIFDNISYEQAELLAQNGAKVIHKNAIKYAKKKKIPIIIKNTLTKNKGTIIQ